MRLLLTSCAGKVIGKTLTFLPKAPRDCKIICIPTAANGEDGDKQWLADELNDMRSIGFDLTMFELEDKTEIDLARAIKDADIVYLTGGNTFYLLGQMRACNFEKVIREFLARGGLYIGSSASTIAACPDINYVRSMDDPSKAPSLTDTRGLHLVDFYVMVHMDNTSFAQKANDKIKEMKLGPVPVLCLNDDQAIFVDGQSTIII